MSNGRTSKGLVGLLTALVLMAVGAVSGVAWNHEGRITRAEEQLKSVAENPPKWLADLVSDLKTDLAVLGTEVQGLKRALEER